MVTRVYTVSPKMTELFCLRLLTYNVRGPTSFEGLRTLDDGTVCETYVEAAKVCLIMRVVSPKNVSQERGLVNNQMEWDNAMAHSARRDFPPVIRRLFAVIIIHCTVIDKQGTARCIASYDSSSVVTALFDKYAEYMYDRGSASTATKRARALFHIDSILKNYKLRNSEVGLQEVSITESAVTNPLSQADASQLHWKNDRERRRTDEGTGFHISAEEAHEKAQKSYADMNDDQKEVFKKIMRSIRDPQGHRCWFLQVRCSVHVYVKSVRFQGPGGTGKTFTYKAIFHAALYYGKKVFYFVPFQSTKNPFHRSFVLHRPELLPLCLSAVPQYIVSSQFL